MNDKLLNSIEQHGYAGRIVSIGHLHELRESIETYHRKGVFDEGFYQEYLKGFVFAPPESMPDARSLIVIAVKQPQVRLMFSWKGHTVPVIVPPTYLHAADVDREVRDVLAEALGKEGYKVAPAVLPKKLLAAHSGLATYGRNNITYVAGMGSFHRLSVFYSDMSCDGEDSWQEVKMMERCNDCHACMRKCPAGAISPDRFLLYAEKCIVYHNEKPAGTPFPEWMHDSWHNCLVGCMHCQIVCPENRESVRTVEDGAEFSPEETELLISGAPPDQLSAPMLQKLEKCDLVSMLDIIPRNLRVLLDR